MNKVRLGRTNLMVTELAFGGIPIQRLSTDQAVQVVRDVIDMGINFIDTAWGYTNSEERIGEAIKSYPRESLIIASKSPAPDGSGFRRQLEESLRRLDTDYLDIYQHHNVSGDAKMQAVLGKNGAWEEMQKAMEEGLIRHPAFSAHSLETAEKMMRTGNYEVTQLPFNFVDTAAEKVLLPLARELDMGFICMKPLGGGLLDNAKLCFRFLRQYPGLVPDPGIENSGQMREIIGIYEDNSPLTADEQKQMDAIRTDLGGSWCHRCDYCQPCPEGIPISMVLPSQSMTRRMPLDKTRALLDSAMAKSENCTRCGECETRCPYDLPIRDLLVERRGQYANFIESGTWA